MTSRVTLVLGMVWLLAAGVAASSASVLPVASGILLHLDASDVDGDGTPGGSLVDAGVAKWVDKSGQGHDVTQTDLVKHPTVVANGLNGLPVLSFDGDNDYLFRTDAMGLTGNPALTGFVVVNNGADVGADDRRIVQMGVGASDGADNATYGFAVESSWRFNGGNRVFANDPLDDGSPHIGVWRTAAGATYGEHEFYRDGPTAAIPSGANNQDGTSDLKDEGLGVGGRWVGGDSVDNPGFTTQIDIAEIIIYDRQLSIAEMNQVGVYLQDKWGIAGGFVPEPASLMLLGLAGAALLRRR